VSGGVVYDSEVVYDSSSTQAEALPLMYSSTRVRGNNRRNMLDPRDL